MVAAALRVPAHIKGDAEHTVQQLIDKENEDPRRGYGHENVLTEITVDRDTLDLLEKKGITVYRDLSKHIFMSVTSARIFVFFVN